METIILKIGYAAWSLERSFVIRYPHERRNKADQIRTDKKGPLEKILLVLVFLGMMIVPFIYMFSDLLSFCRLYTSHIVSDVRAVVDRPNAVVVRHQGRASCGGYGSVQIRWASHVHGHLVLVPCAGPAPE